MESLTIRNALYLLFCTKKIVLTTTKARNLKKYKKHRKNKKHKKRFLIFFKNIKHVFSSMLETLQHPYAPFAPKILMGFCSDGPENVPAKFEVRSFTPSLDNWSSQKISCSVTGYARPITSLVAYPYFPKSYRPSIHRA